MWLFLVLWSWVMAGNGPSTLYFSGGGGVPWQHASANGQILGAVPKTPPESEVGCYEMGRFRDGRIWIAAERSFHIADRALKTWRGGVVPVESIAGQSQRYLYRIRRGPKLPLPKPAHDFAAVLDRIDPRDWSIRQSWTLPDPYSTYGKGQLAVDDDIAVAYYATENATGCVRRHDLTADQPLPDLVSRSIGSGGLLALSDRSVVIGYTDGVQRVGVDGHHLQTYAVAALRAGQGLLTHGASDASFWVQGYEDGTAYSTLYEVGTERGEIRHQWNTPANGVKWDAPFVDPPSGTCIPAGSIAFNEFDTNPAAPVVYIDPATFTILDVIDRANGDPFGPTDALDDGTFVSGVLGSDPAGSILSVRAPCTQDFVGFISTTPSGNGPSGGSFVRGNYTDRFYVGGSGTGNVIIAYGAHGAFVQEWSTPRIVRQVAVGSANDIAYYTSTSVGNTKTIFRHDLINDVDLGAWVTEATRVIALSNGYHPLLVLRDGTVLAGWSGNFSTNSQIVHYAADASVLHTYSRGATSDAFSLGADVGDSSFWVVYTGSAETWTYEQIAISSGTALTFHEITNAEWNNVVAATGEPTAFFDAHAFFITREDCNCAMACPDPCETAGTDQPYLALSAESNTTIFYDRAFTKVSDVSTPGCVAIAPTGDGKCWIAMDDGSGASIIYLVDPATIDPGTFEATIERTITTEAGILIAELGGRHALWQLDCDRLLTVDRGTHELITLCLPSTPDGVALVEQRFSLVIDPLDGFLTDGGRNLLYLDAGVAKVWNLKNDALLRTVGAVGGIWPVVLNDNTFLVWDGAFRSGGANVLRYTRNGKLVQRYPVDIVPTILSDGLYGMAADLQTDACACGNKKEGVIWLPGEENPAVIPVTLLDGEQKTYIILDDVVQGGIDTAAAFTVLSPSDGSGFNSQTSGGGGPRPQPNRHCGDEGKRATVQPNPGCNPGGKGFVNDYNGASGTVPACDDPTDEETLTGKSAIYVDTEIRHTWYPSHTTEVIRSAHVELDDTTRKEGRLQSAGRLENSLSDGQGNMKSASADLSFFDAEGRPFGIRVADATKRHFQRDEITIRARSDVGRRTGATSRILWRGLAYGDRYGTPVVFGLTAIDHLHIEGGAFSPDKKFPQFTFPRAFYTESPEDLAQLPMAIILGEVTDHGAVDPLTGLPAARGKMPWRYVGMDGLGTAPGGEPWGRGNACLFAIYKITHVYGSDLGAMNLYGRAATVSVLDSHQGDDDTDTSTSASETTLVTLDGSPDLTAVPTDETAMIVLFTESGRTEATITAVDNFAKTVTISSTIDPALAQGVSWYIASIDYVPRRVEIDLSTRNGVDVMVPKWAGYIRPTDYEDFTSIDGDFRVTDFWVRGPLLDAHLAGEVTIAFNAIGIEDQGDSTGTPITDYFTAMNWLWDNAFIRQLAAPLAGLWPQTNGDVEVWADGTSKVKSSSFEAAQAQTVAELGGRGLQISAYFAEGMPIRDAAQLLNDNGGCRTYIDEHGRIGVWRFDPYADASAWPRVDHVSRVFGDIRQTHALDEALNYVKGGCDWDADGQKFREDDLKAVSDDAIDRNKTIRRYSKHIDGKLIANKAHFQALLDRILYLNADGPVYVEVDGLDAGGCDYSVGDGILLTSMMGPGALGYVDRPMVILDKSVDADGLLVNYVCLDVGELLIASEQQFILTNNVSGPIVSNDESIAPVLAA